MYIHALGNTWELHKGGDGSDGKGKGVCEGNER